MKEPVILAFDTSAHGFTVAWYRGGETTETEFTPNLRNADAIFGEIDRLLKKAKAKINDADVVAVGLGPGSFTGIRVGVSAAKTFAYAAGKKLMGFSSLEIQSLNWKGPAGTVSVVQDAGRGNVYTAAFVRSGTVRPPCLMGIEDFMGDAQPSFYYMGNALLQSGFAGRLEKLAGRSHVDPDPALARPRAERMIPLALERWATGGFDDPLTLAPDYLYDRECNVTLKSKEGI